MKVAHEGVAFLSLKYATPPPSYERVMFKTLSSLLISSIIVGNGYGKTQEGVV
jgi:hypothetical protein